MAKIEFPKQLKSLLEGSNLNGPIRLLADRVGEILADNKLPFFPDYTDHGIDHINCVLKSEVELVPNEVWEQSKEDSNPRLLRDCDAAVIIGATLLHDIAMHLRKDGFRKLISKESPFQPLPWFKDSHEGRRADQPWDELWDEYAREARRFNDRTLANIVGLESVRDGWKFQGLPEGAGRWEENHFRVTGEFIRRHHARLAHEIAIYGLPGLPVGSGEGQFPAMGREEGHALMRLADLVGLTARSHGTSLRECKAYLDYKYPKTPRPMGTVALYAMAMLRVADYLQIDHQRAPAALLQLRNPQSPISVQEWKKHLAVQSINPANDPRAKTVTVSSDLSLELYLQLRDLLAGLQSEMDHSTAVLDEAYGTRSDLGLNQLGLATRRVYSDLESPAFRDSLPYVPERTGFSADPNLLALLVEPLYGENPGVGVRELMQNSLDAVCELDAWCRLHGKAIASLDLPDQEADVLIEFIEQDDKRWLLRVQDKGIGMSSDTIQKYFLRAGASFRQSAEWAKEFLDDNGEPRVLRAGRFGVGAFAIFLLGPSFRMSTRHAGADRSMGYAIEASADSQLIEIHRSDGLHVGTTIEVELTSESAADLKLDVESRRFGGTNDLIDWFCWDWPKLVKRVVCGATEEILDQKYTAPLRKAKPGPEWSVIHPEGFDAVYWSFITFPDLTCNGLRIAQNTHISKDYGWPKETLLRHPNIAVADSAANLPLTIQRYELSQNTPPFIDELTRDVFVSFIAHALVCGPISREEAHSSGLPRIYHPLMLNPYWNFFRYRLPDPSGLLWCSTPSAVIPLDPWLYSLLKPESCIVYGVLTSLDSGLNPTVLEIPLASTSGNCAACRLDSFSRTGGDRNWKLLLQHISLKGLPGIGNFIGSHVLISVNPSVGRGWEWEQEWGWNALPNTSESQRLVFEIQTGMVKSSLQLDLWLRELDSKLSHWSQIECFYVALVNPTPDDSTPKSMIAKIWNECLGPTAIPFDPAARKALIELGRQHSELKRHIEAWEKMKGSRSRYVFGDSFLGSPMPDKSKE